jgi:hypothetical protein
VVRESSPTTEEPRTTAKNGETSTERREPETSADNGHTPPAPRRKRHWLRRLIIGIVLLVVVLALVIQLVLWSNLPRRLVLAQLQNQLGLRIQASSLTTGWLGNTNLRDVTLGLPMAEQSFLDMPHMQVKHTSLFGLLLLRPVSVDRIVLDNPTLYVRRDETGRWNLQQVAELVAKAGGAKPADESAKQSRPKLPEVRLNDGSVVIQDYGKTESRIRPLRAHGRPDPKTPGILWRYDVEVPDHLKLVGQVIPGDPWPHEVDLSVNRVEAWLKPFVPAFPPDAVLAANWRGSITNGAVNGRLDLQQLSASGATAKGVMLVSNQGGMITLKPDGLTVASTAPPGPEARVASGSIVYDGRAVRTERLFIAALGGQTRVDADFTLATRSGQLNAEWLDITTGDIRHSGSLDAKVGSTFQNRPQLEAKLVSRGVSPDGPWDATFQLNGTSQGGWADMDYVLKAPNLDWKGHYPLKLDGLVAKLETRVDEKTKQRVIRLADLAAPPHQVQSVGEYNLQTQHWKFWIGLNALPIPGDGGAPPRKESAPPAWGGAYVAQAQQGKQNAASLSVVLNTWGDAEKLEVGELTVRGAEFELRGSGDYVYARPSPLDINLKVRHIPPRIAERDRPPLYGYLSGEARVAGTVFEPRNLSIMGKLRGEGVTFYNRSVGDLDIQIAGKADNNSAYLESQQFEFLKAHWKLNGRYRTDAGDLTVKLGVADLDLGEVGDLIPKFDPNDTRPVRRTEEETDLLAGKLTGDWTLVIPRTDKDRLRLDGGAHIEAVRAPGFTADAIDAKTALADGVLTLGPIQLKRAITRTVDGSEKRLEGKADASFSADLDDLTQITAALNLQNWPLEAGADGWLDISGGSQKLVIDLKSEPDKRQVILPGKSAAGTINFVTALTYKGQALGKTEIVGDFLGRMIDLRRFDIQTLDGNVTGNGVIELEKPLEARAFFSWENVNSARLVDLFPALKGLEGVYTGRLRVQPTVEPRALGPLAVSFESTPTNGRYNAIDIGRTLIFAYADADRFVLNDPADLGSTIELGGGLLQLWGRISYHNLQGTRDAVSSQVLVHFKGLDLNQIIHAANPEEAPTPGRLDGTLTIMAATRGPRTQPLKPGEPPPSFVEKLATAVTAHGKVNLTQAKLGALPVFSFLYDVMSAGQNVKASNGVGNVEVRLENGNLELNNLQYFNRGTEVRGMFTIERVWDLPNSPLYGSAIGSLRALASLNLPFVAEFDRLIALLSSDLASIGVEGTVKKPDPYQIGIRDLGRSLQILLLGDVPQTAAERKAPPRKGAGQPATTKRGKK